MLTKISLGIVLISCIVFPYPTHGQEVAKKLYSMAWSHDSRLIALGYEQGYIELVDTETRTIIYAGQVLDSAVRSLAWHPTSHLLAIGDEVGVISLFDADSHTILKSMAEG